MSYNICILAGNVTRKPEMKYTPKGTACAEFGLAINEVYYNDQNEKCENVSFFDIVAWEAGAEFAVKHLDKGSFILVEGKLKQDTWDDKQTGDKRSKVRIVARKLSPCFATWKDSRNPRDEDAGRTAAPWRPQRPTQQERPPADPDLDPPADDIPF